MTARPDWTLDVGGVEIVVHELGGDGPPLVIAHATGFCGAMYRPMAERLGDIRRVVALDFRAHGDSGRPSDGDLAWHGTTDDVSAVIAALDADGPVDAFGHSMGGASLLWAEARRPGILRRVVAFEPIVVPADLAAGDGPSPLVVAARQRRAEFDDRPSALRRYASRPPLNTLRADVLHTYVAEGFRDTDDGHVRLKCEPMDEAAVFDAPDKPTPDDVRPGRAEVLLLVSNETDPTGPAAFTRGTASSWPRATLEEVDHVTHFGPFEDPVGVAEIVRRWIS